MPGNRLVTASGLRGCDRELSITDSSGTVRGVKVKVPAGVTDGAKIRVRGQGQPGALRAADESQPSHHVRTVVTVTIAKSSR